MGLRAKKSDFENELLGKDAGRIFEVVQGFQFESLGFNLLIYFSWYCHREDSREIKKKTRRNIQTGNLPWDFIISTSIWLNFKSQSVYIKPKYLVIIETPRQHVLHWAELLSLGHRGWRNRRRANLPQSSQWWKARPSSSHNSGELKPIEMILP